MKDIQLVAFFDSDDSFFNLINWLLHRADLEKDQSINDGELSARMMPYQPCEWNRDIDGVWSTTCGERHYFLNWNGSPEDYKYNYCPYCGFKIKS